MTLSTMVSDIQTRLGLDSTSSFISSPTIKGWVNHGYFWALNYKDWPFSETVDKSLVAVSGQEEYAYPSDIKSDSIKYLKINGYRYRKIKFDDYLKYRENYDSTQERIFTDYGRTLYVNPLASDFSGSFYLYATKQPSSLSLDADTTLFATADTEAEEAIIKYAQAIGLKKMEEYNQANNIMQEATLILERIWEKTKNQSATYESREHPMFDRIDILQGVRYDDGFNNKQF